MKPSALIVGDRRKHGVRDGVRRALPGLERRLDVVGVDLDEKLDLAKAKADLLLAFGGDGTFLHVAHRLGANPIPVLGVNFGRLGYLADLAPEDLDAGIDVFVAGRGRIWERTRLRCVRRSASGAVHDAGTALNDVVLGRAVLGRMVEVDVRVDGAEAITIAGDGLIVATASGSTAHALSAGGPLVEPTLDAIVLVPICPHALANRPLVVSESARIELRVRTREPGAAEGDGAVVVVDGRAPSRVGVGDVVEVTDARTPLRVVSVSGRSYFDLLRHKLGWRGRPNYRDRDGALEADGGLSVVRPPAPVPPPAVAPPGARARRTGRRADRDPPRTP